MSLITKIRQSKVNQLEQYNAGRVNPKDTSFYLWVKQMIGKLHLLVHRKFYDPHNILQWTMPIDGISETNQTIDPIGFYGLKFTREILRGDYATEYKIGDYNLWSFFAGVEGAYRVGCVFKLLFPSQSVATEWYTRNLQLSEPTLTLAINGILLTHPIAWSNGLLQDGLTLKTQHRLTGTQNIYLKKGDRLNIFLNIRGFISPVPKSFTVFGHISVNFLTKKTRIINSQVI